MYWVGDIHTARITKTFDAGSDINGVTMVPMDVNEDSSVRAAIDYIQREAGPVDVLINNAGFGISGAIEDTSVEEARALFETNFFGLIFVYWHQHAYLAAISYVHTLLSN